jgi:hypothetical protein
MGITSDVKNVFSNAFSKKGEENKKLVPFY